MRPVTEGSWCCALCRTRRDVSQLKAWFVDEGGTDEGYFFLCAVSERGDSCFVKYERGHMQQAALRSAS